MVGWQFTVFCREVGFVEIYSFLVLIFFGQKCISAIFITFCISDPQESEWWRHKVMVPLLTYREQFHDMKGRIDKCEARRADYDRWSKPSCQCCFQWFTYNRSCMSVCMWRKSDKNLLDKIILGGVNIFSLKTFFETFCWNLVFDKPTNPNIFLQKNPIIILAVNSKYHYHKWNERIPE